MPDLFGQEKKQQLSSRQREVLKILSENIGSYARPYKQKDPKAARKYSIQSSDGIIIIPSVRRSVINNLYKFGKLNRIEMPDGIHYYSMDGNGLSIEKVELSKDGLLSATYLMPDIEPENLSHSEINLQHNLKIIRQQLNG